MACLPLEVRSKWLPPAGVAAEDSVGRRTGDSGSHEGRGGVAARGGACLYCALKDVTFGIVVECAEGARSRRVCCGDALGLASQVQLWSGSAMRMCEGSGRGHVLGAAGAQR